MRSTIILTIGLVAISAGLNSADTLLADEFEPNEFNVNEFDYFNTIDRFSGETESFISADADIEPYDEYGDFSASHSDVWTENTTFYLSANNYLSFNHLEVGGYNTNFFVPNRGTDSNVSHDFGLALGARIPFCCKALRIEVEGAVRDLDGLLSESLRPESASETYQVDYDDRWSVMTNLWLDFPFHETKTFYLGGGIGANGGRITVNDGRQGGQSRFTEFTWQVGCGITWERSERLIIDLGYRYMDYGSSAVVIKQNSNQYRSGVYTADLTSHQLMLGLRFRSLGNLFGRR